MFKVVPDHNGKYLVSNTGLVLGRKRRQLRLQTDKYGYRTIRLSKNGEKKWRKVHRLVAEAFLPLRPTDADCVNHKDLDKQNNNVANLEWVSPKENIRHAISNKGSWQLKGENSGTAKLSEENVRKIRSLSGTVLQKDLAVQYGVSRATICLIVNRKHWRSI